VHSSSPQISRTPFLPPDFTPRRSGRAAGNHAQIHRALGFGKVVGDLRIEPKARIGIEVGRSAQRRVGRPGQRYFRICTPQPERQAQIMKVLVWWSNAQLCWALPRWKTCTSSFAAFLAHSAQGLGASRRTEGTPAALRPTPLRFFEARVSKPPSLGAWGFSRRRPCSRSTRVAAITRSVRSGWNGSWCWTTVGSRQGQWLPSMPNSSSGDPVSSRP
jgi:hypothetical protein